MMFHFLFRIKAKNSSLFGCIEPTKIDSKMYLSMSSMHNMFVSDEGEELFASSVRLLSSMICSDSLEWY